MSKHFEEWKESLIKEIFQECYAEVLKTDKKDIFDYTKMVIKKYEQKRLNKTIEYIKIYYNSDGGFGKWRDDLPDGEYFNRYDIISALDGFINIFGDINYLTKDRLI